MGAALVALVLVVFGRTVRHGFVAFDDPSYVSDNAMVRRGLTADGIRWALTTSDRFYWHPVTWLSHMADADVYGGGASGPHATNVAIHAMTALLVFVAFGRMTSAWGRSAIVAAAFAVHPLNVEPVAWIAERKALLAGFFWFSTLAAYTGYVRRPTAARYAFVCGCFVLGLMSKPDVVTLPLVLLLLDVWPLARVSAVGPRRLVVEKLPLLALSAAAAVFTYVAQRNAGAMVLLEHLSLGDRLRHGIVAYGIYLRQFVWPDRLAVLYPYPSHEGTGAVIAAAATLGAIAIVAAACARRAPFVGIGGLWFAVALLPMIGLVQVGAQSHADRFMYVPAVGLTVAVVWSAGAWFERSRAIAMATAIVVVAALTVAAAAQVRYWRDSVTLMSRTVTVTENNAIALHLLAFSLAQDRRLEEAIPVYRASLAIAPVNALAWYNLGLAQAALRDTTAALQSFGEAVRLAPSYGEARVSFGAELFERRRWREAAEEFDAALRLPLDRDLAADASFRLGLIAAYEGDIAAAKGRFDAALRFRPDFAAARTNRDKASQLLARR